MAAVFPAITIERTTSSQRIPGFKEVIASIGHDSAASTPRDFAPRNNSLVGFRMDQRPLRTNLAPHELRLNIAGAVEAADGPTYMYDSRSPMSATTLLHLSPSSLPTPIDPISASSTLSTQSMRSNRGRMTRRQPSSRPAAKRMRDTRDREGLAIQQMETDLEAAGCLADLKPLNANNKEEAGRRYPKADVLERYCELSNTRRRKLRLELQKLTHDSRKCQTYQKWVERWCSSLNKDALDQLEVMMAEATEVNRQPSFGPSFDSSGASFSTRSSISDYDRHSPSSGEWSAEEHDLAAAAATGALPHRSVDPYPGNRP